VESRNPLNGTEENSDIKCTPEKQNAKIEKVKPATKWADSNQKPKVSHTKKGKEELSCASQIQTNQAGEELS